MRLLHKLREKTLQGILAGAILAGSASMFPAIQQQARAQETVQSSRAHYLQGIDVPDDPVKKLFEKERVYNSIKGTYSRQRPPIINESIQIKQTILGKNVTLTFVNYVNKGDHVVHYTSNGMQRLTYPEFQAVVQDHAAYIEESALTLEKRFKEPSKRILETVEANLRKAKKLPADKKLEDILNEQITGYDGITVRDALLVPPPALTAKDFLPQQYYFGVLPTGQRGGSILGVTYLNVGVVGIDPKARILDYINGKPTILMHEMMHANEKLQGMPLVFYFDAELYADLAEISNMDYLEITSHPYLDVPRQLSDTLFSFNSDLAFENVRDFAIMPGTSFEESAGYKKLRKTMHVVNDIAKKFQTKSLEEFFPEFYASPHYWITVNEFHRDGTAAFKIFFYANYEPTSLGGPEATRKFMEENKEVIKETSEQVLKELRNRNTRQQTYGVDQLFPLLTFGQEPSRQQNIIIGGLGIPVTYDSLLEQRLKEKNFSPEQARVGVVMGERALFLKEIKDVNEDQGTATYRYKFNYSGITIADMLDTFNGMLNDMDDALSRKNELRWEKYLDHFKLRDVLEKKRIAVTYIRDTLAHRQLYNEFRDLMGLRPKQITKDFHKIQTDETYSLAALLPDSAKELVFDAKYVQDARRAGKIADERNIVESITQDIAFYERIPNPDYPMKDPNKEYIFKKRDRRIKIISYNLDDNTEKNPTYIEVYRLRTDGTRETLPAIKIFKSATSSTLDVLVADKDKEDDKKGFGKPDFVSGISGITIGSDLQRHHQNVIEYIFQENDVPPLPTIKTTTEAHIIETGKYPFAQHEIKAEGWQNEVPDHKQSEFNNNYRVHIKLEDAQNDEEEQNEQHYKKKPRKIEWIAKAYRGVDGRIVAFYKPSDSIKDHAVTDIKGTATELELHELGKPIEKYSLEYLVKEKPFRIDFDYSSEKRWSIIDKDNDGTIYEAKQEIRKPDDLKLPQLPR
ncbi:hypothetical protein HY485_03745 [Candidatus Woesearchaeota archaeon]|nr:hypothetical protein [Candidatus Woesearchaeota archaeon]